MDRKQVRKSGSVYSRVFFLTVLLTIVPIAVGCVYFTDSTDIEPTRVGTRTYDTMYGAKSDLLRGSKTGRLLRYDPKNDKVDILARSLSFPNGIGVDKDETYLVFAETFGLRFWKYSLSTNVLEVMIDGDLTGFPDGLDCSESSDTCYSVMPSSVTPLVKAVHAISHPFDMILRSVLMGLPKYLAPKVKPYGGLVVIDVRSKTMNLIQDPTGEDIGHLAGVTKSKFDNKLYLGSLKNGYIGVYDLI